MNCSITDSIFSCKICGKKKKKTHSSKNIYCSNECSQEGRRQESIERLKQGQLTDRATIGKALAAIFGRLCKECGIVEWRGKPAPLEVDHIDGDAGNNSFENLRLVCANCHGITPTWKGRNKGNGRLSRGLPLG